MSPAPRRRFSEPMLWPPSRSGILPPWHGGSGRSLRSNAAFRRSFRLQPLAVLLQFVDLFGKRRACLFEARFKREKAPNRPHQINETKPSSGVDSPLLAKEQDHRRRQDDHRHHRKEQRGGDANEKLDDVGLLFLELNRQEFDPVRKGSQRM